MKTQYLGSVNYGHFTKCKLVQVGEWKQQGYWKGQNEVRNGTRYTYILLCGSHPVGNALGFCHHIFRVPKQPVENLDLLIWDGHLEGEVELGTWDDFRGFHYNDPQ